MHWLMDSGEPLSLPETQRFVEVRDPISSAIKQRLVVSLVAAGGKHHWNITGDLDTNGYSNS